MASVTRGLEAAISARQARVCRMGLPDGALWRGQIRMTKAAGLTHRKDRDEEWALRLLEQILERDRADRDALPGAVVGKVKEAAVILRKRRKGE
jgi:hypothetical protein